MTDPVSRQAPPQRFLALACDFDGTIADDGMVDQATLAALERVRASGRRLILVTGRELGDLQRVFGRLDLFDRVITENGAVLFRAETHEERSLAEPPDERLVAYLQACAVRPLSLGRSIVATWEPNETVVLEAIRTLGLELQIIFNKGAVMVLPPGVSKASGLVAALHELRLSSHNVIGVGDAENDHAFLALCELSAAVGNALPAVKERADIVLEGRHGAGVQRLAEMLLAGDLQRLEGRLPRLIVPVGESDGQPIGPSGHGALVLLAGASGSGKSTLTMAFVESLIDRGYQVCLVDPEGDYEHIEELVVLGTADRPATPEEVLTVLDDPDRSVVVNLLGLGLEERPPFTATLLERLHELRRLYGRPHWIVLDEAHHVLPVDWGRDGPPAHEDLTGVLLVTVHPDRLARGVLRELDLLLAVGPDARATVAEVARVIGLPLPEATAPAIGEGLLWRLPRVEPRTAPTREVGGPSIDDRSPSAEGVLVFTLARPRGELRRHRRKYAAGDLGFDKSFWFRGEDHRLNLRAQNLAMFIQIAEGVDDATWSFHLRSGDYSGWIRDAIKDGSLAGEVAAVESDASLDADESRRRIRDLIESRYTAPR